MGASHDKKMQDFTSALCDAAWQRLRSLALATARYENLVPLEFSITANASDTPLPDPASKHDFRRTSDALAQDFLLFALQDIIDTQNFRILRAILQAENGQTIEALAKATGETDMRVRERVAVLTQAGVVQKDFDTGKVFFTVEGEIVVKAVVQAIEILAETIVQKLPKILGEAGE
jgi:predicted transcriptional regulator